MRIIFFSVIVFLSFHCSKSETIPPPEMEPPVQSPPKMIKYLALGDSYTIGQSVSVEDRYPNQLATQLEADSVLMDTTLIFAKTGWTTTDLQNTLTIANMKDTFDLVSLLIGVNNQYQNKPIDQYEIEFEELLQIAIDFAGGDKEKVFVLSIPDYAFTPFGNGNPSISDEIDDFNFSNKTITDNYGISYFDITPISTEGLDKPELVASDGLHPSGEQYTRWVELIYDAVKTKVEE